MKIFAKQNTELESVLKGFYEQMEREKTEVIEMVEKFTYAKPINFGYYWYFGITCVWAEDTIRFADITSLKMLLHIGHTDIHTLNQTRGLKPERNL